MSLFDQVERKPTAEQGAQQVRRAMQGVFTQIQGSLEQVQRIMTRHGRKEVEAALGKEDAEQAKKLYGELKKFVEAHKPGAPIEDLPK